MSILWHYIQNGTTLGPIPEEELRKLITSGALHPSDTVWHEGMGTWMTIQATPELSNFLAPPPTKGMGSGAKVAIGCGGLFLLFLVIGGIASSGSKGGNGTPLTNSARPTLSALQANATDDADLTIKRYGPPDRDTNNLGEHAALAQRYLIYKKENLGFLFIGKGDSNGEAPAWKLMLTRNANDTKSSDSIDPKVIANRMKNRDVTLEPTNSLGTRQQPLQVQAKDLYHAYAYDSSGDAKFKDGYVLIEAVVSDTGAIMKDDLDNALNLDERYEMPGARELREESKISQIPLETLRMTYPSISLLLSSTSRGSNGMGLRGDILFVFNSHPEDLKKITIGTRVRIVGKVSGWIKDVVLVRDCKLIP